MQAAEKDIRDRRYSREAGILVTGVTGFLGSHLVSRLREAYEKAGIGPEDLDLENLDLSVEKVDERISPSETNVFDK